MDIPHPIADEAQGLIRSIRDQSKAILDKYHIPQDKSEDPKKSTRICEYCGRAFHAVRFRKTCTRTHASMLMVQTREGKR